MQCILLIDQLILNIINSYKNKSDKKTKELSIEVYLNDNNYMKENKKYKTPEKSLNRKINEKYKDFCLFKS